MPRSIDDDDGDGAITRREFEHRLTDIVVTITEIQGEIKNMRDLIRGLEMRLDERAGALKVALDRVDTNLMERLETMNQFRQQLNQERVSYITTEKLDLILKTIRSEIDNVRSQLSPLQTRQDYNKGRDSTLYATIAIGLGVAALFIELLRTFMGH